MQLDGEGSQRSLCEPFCFGASMTFRPTPCWPERRTRGTVRAQCAGPAPHRGTPSIYLRLYMVEAIEDGCQQTIRSAAMCPCSVRKSCRRSLHGWMRMPTYAGHLCVQSTQDTGADLPPRATPRCVAASSDCLHYSVCHTGG